MVGQKKSVATLRNPHGSETSITSGYSTQYMDVEFLGDRNIFIHVDLKNGVAFTVHWTGYNIYITVNASLQDQTCGLCGTFNDMKEDDFHLRSGDDKEIGRA